MRIILQGNSAGVQNTERQGDTRHEHALLSAKLLCDGEHVVFRTKGALEAAHPHRVIIARVCVGTCKANPPNTSRKLASTGFPCLALPTHKDKLPERSRETTKKQTKKQDQTGRGRGADEEESALASRWRQLCALAPLCAAM